MLIILSTSKYIFIIVIMILTQGYVYFRERGSTHLDWGIKPATQVCTLTGELNPRPSSAWDDTATEPHQPGLGNHFISS